MWAISHKHTHVFFYETHDERKSSKSRKAVSKVVSGRQEVQGWPLSISDIKLETEVQIQFLTNCKRTLIAQRDVGVWMEGWNTSLLATRMIQIRSFMRVFLL